MAHNLPLQPTPFIGRAAELNEVCQLLADPACRLLTLTGPGGIGKTRLAIQAAVQFVDVSDRRALPFQSVSSAGVRPSPVPPDNGFADGVYFIPLQPVQSMQFLISALADAIDYPLAGHVDSRLQLLHTLRDRQMLLLLDNFEHLLATGPFPLAGEVASFLVGAEDEAALSVSLTETGTAPAVDLLSDILSVALGVKLLVTSREVLNLREEWIYQVQGLPYPKPTDSPLRGGETDGEGIAAYGAVQLFAERARQVRRDFSLAEEAAAVAHICHIVEGMPLAIELAASWTRTMPCAVIAAEIQRNIDFLATGLRNVPDRQKSMRAVFDQSWRMLSPVEQNAFKRLSVFRGSFDRTAAERIAGATLATLSVLVDKSLLRPEPNGRYQIHELLRQYAALQLAQSPEAIARVYDVHCAYYADFLYERQADMAGARQREAAAAIKAELENVRAAWQWAISMAKVEEVQKGAQTLAWFCQFQSRYLEAADAFEKAVHGLARAEATPQRELALATVLVELAWFYIRLGRLAQAQAAVEQSQMIYHRLGVPPVLGQATDPRLPLGIIASIRGDYVAAAQLGEEARRVSEAHNRRGNLPFALYLLARTSLAAGDLEAARRYAQEACDIVEEAGDRWFLAYCLNELGNVASALGDYAQAQQHYQSSYAIRQAFEDPEGMALALNHLGKIASLQDDYRQAEQLYRQSLALYQEINDRGGLATSHNGLGIVACALRDPPAARQHFQQALQIAMDIQFVPLTLSVLMEISQLLLRCGQPERGIELLAFVRQHPASERETKDRAQRCLERYRAELAPQLFAAASQRGQQGDLQTIASALHVELASLELGLVAAPPANNRPAPPPEQPLVEPLTARELEVLRLIADGLTNQQIAESLIISVGTVKFYTSQIYGKLSVSSRTQAVARARDLGLLS